MKLTPKERFGDMIAVFIGVIALIVLYILNKLD
jgi:hypothetical protein